MRYCFTLQIDPARLAAYTHGIAASGRTCSRATSKPTIS